MKPLAFVFIRVIMLAVRVRIIVLFIVFLLVEFQCRSADTSESKQ
jgi:hypothetical protein